MKKLLLSGLMAAVLAGCSASEPAEPFEAPKGLREGTPVAVTQVQGEQPLYPKSGKGQLIERNWQGQPPLIPHAANKPINLKRNGCLMCHKPAKPGKTPKATPTHQSHYLADGKTLNNGFYNCNQCHVPQSQITPEVGSNY